MKKLFILLVFAIASSMTSFAYTNYFTCTVNQTYVFSTLYNPGNPFYIQLYAKKAGVATREDDEAFCGFAGYDNNSNLLIQKVVLAEYAYQTVRMSYTVRTRNIYRLELYLHADRKGDLATIFLRW